MQAKTKINGTFITESRYPPIINSINLAFQNYQK